MSNFSVLEGKTVEVQTGCGSIYVTINFKDDKPFEVFARLGKAGGCATAQTEAVARLASGWLRGGLELERLIKQLVGIRCNNPAGFGDEQILSCSDAIGKTIRKVTGHLVLETTQKIEGDLPNLAQDRDSPFDGDIRGGCPDCGSSSLANQEGCLHCMICGWSKCD